MNKISDISSELTDSIFTFIKHNIFITDTAGQERYRSLTKMFYKGADGILIGFSLTEPSSLESVNYWVEQINENCSKDRPISLVLFGNKCDDEENIKVGDEEINQIKNKYNLKFFKTSAKKNIKVQDVFERLGLNKNKPINTFLYKKINAVIYKVFS